MAPASKKAKTFLGDSDSESSGDENGVALNGGAGDGSFKINEDYARRFEYNKKREEMAKLEEKLGKSALKRKRPAGEDGAQDSHDSDESSSESEDEDDDGVLATEALDSEINATLQAIRSKDPRVYDDKVTFYTPFDPESLETTNKSEKPMYLRDYHRENLLKGTAEDDVDDVPRTFAQEQEDLRNSLVKQAHADESDDEGADDSDDGGFLIPKTKNKGKGKATDSAAAKVELDLENADKDPETFLSNFLSARAWVPTERAQLQPFDSDDDDEDARAEKFETAYNFRFEDPSLANEKLVTHARDTTSKYSVRREEPNMRKKRRDVEREKKEAEKQERHEERARLRKLKIEEMEEKVKKIKRAAGLKGADLKDDDWTMVLDDDFDDKKWEEEMSKRFDETYYAEEDALSEDEDAEGASKKKRKPKKPQWDDDIDIKDLVPDFDDEEAKKPEFSLSDAEGDVAMEDAEEEEEDGPPKKKSKKNKEKEKKDEKRAERKERRRIEQLVDRNLDLDPTLLPGSSKQRAAFRYRETSPTSYGLTARDILMADDTQLNQFAGLKKLASFRDEERKKKDQKKLGKKARLRQWRKDTFGDENGPSAEVVESSLSGPARPAAGENDDANEDGVDIREGKKKRKRSRKNKTAA